MRRASPPASTTAMMCSGIARYARLGTLRSFLDCRRIGIKDNALGATQRNKAAAFCTTDQSEVRLTRQIHAPGRKAVAADQNRDFHAHDLDDHFRCQPTSCV